MCIRDSLTSALDNIRIYHAVNGHYPWEHPKCDHAFLAQDHHMEGVQEGEFIRKSELNYWGLTNPFFIAILYLLDATWE